MTYSWHRDGGSVPSKSKGRNRKTLTICTATPPDEGMYYCMANKEGISVESNRATLTIDGKRIILYYSNIHTFYMYLKFYVIFPLMLEKPVAGY